jgi:EmrB/QacA subfamily drug resistance transporter
MEQSVSLTPAQRRGVLFSMCLSLVLVVASVSSLNLALPSLAVDLGASSGALTWIADGYTVALAALVLPFGALGDRFGRRNILLIGTVLFGLAAIAAVFAGSAGAVIACRIVMGAGAAMIMPGTLSTISAAFPPEDRPRAVAVWAGFAGAGAILGMLVTGLLLEWFAWTAAFVMTGILAVVSFTAALVLTPNTADPDGHPLDVVGALLSGAGIGGLVFGIIEGAEKGWTSGVSLLGFAAAVVGIAGFIWWSLRREHPMLDLRLFKLRGFGTGTAALVIQFLIMFGFFLVGLQFLALVLGYSALHSAVALLPIAIVVMPLSVVTPPIVNRFGIRAVMTAGMLTMAAGLLVLAQLDGHSSYWGFFVGLLITGSGSALCSTPATTAIVSSLPVAQQGVASAVNDVSREVGSAIGIAILGSLFNQGYRDGIAATVDKLPPQVAHAVGESPAAGLAVAGRMGDAGAVLSATVKDAFANGLHSAMIAGAVIAVLGALLIVWRSPRRPEDVDAEAQALELEMELELELEGV